MKTKTTHFIFIFLTIFLAGDALYSQNYRTAVAYLEDFEKNENYVHEALVEYSSSIIYNYKDNRTQTTLERIYIKLETINKNLIKNDVGFMGDVTLRDAFLKMNSYTIELLKNNTLRLNDYDTQKELDLYVLMNSFDLKRSNIINYYSFIVDYTNCKRNFCKKYNLTTTRYFKNRNIFEYDAHQSLIYYKLNVLDAKLCDLLLTTDLENVEKCVSLLNNVCEESLAEIVKYEKVYIDQSLNNANMELIHFIYEQNKNLIPLYRNYVYTQRDFLILKERLKYDDKNKQFIDLYNEKVRILNTSKNLFFDYLNTNQLRKKNILDRWHRIKCNFLRKNT